MSETFTSVQLPDGPEYRSAEDGRLSLHFLYREVLVCSQCTDDCEGLRCRRLDWETQTINLHGSSCLHCEECEKDCCHEVVEDHHYAAVYGWYGSRMGFTSAQPGTKSTPPGSSGIRLSARW